MYNQPPFNEIYLIEIGEVSFVNKHKYIVEIRGKKEPLTHFDTKEQLDGWCKLLGVSMKEKPEKPKYRPDGSKEYELSKKVQRYSLGDRSVLPKGAIQYKGMCNGSIYNCYVTVADESFTIYIPNPFAKTRKWMARLSETEHNKYIEDKKKFLLYSSSFL
ncbi:hypothetical protein ACQUY5_16720 [Bacillus cereus]|uniref:hypothetical protein n=1 Tax=Bacillus cereus TaxID=1396 RepID=UPI003D175C81